MRKNGKVMSAAAFVVVILSVAACAIFSPYAKLYGTWIYGNTSFEFKTDDTFALSQNDGVVYTGTYTATADSFKLSVTMASLDAADVTEAYRAYIDSYNGYDYKWTVEDKTLKITVNDVTSEWTKQ